MNIQYLLDAAAFLESHSSLPLDLQSSAATWTAVGGFSSSSTSCSSAPGGGLFSSASGSSESSSSSSSRDGVEDSSNGGGGSGASAEPKILRKFKGKNSRETHNRLEKDRRAYLRECFANLRRTVEIEDPKCSNLAILQSAVRCIQSLKRQEKQYERETASLAERKIELQQRIGDLKRDLSDRNPDPSFDVNLWLKMHVNHAASVPTDASSDEAASVYAWSSGDSALRRRNLSHSPLDEGRGAKTEDADAESTSTVSLDENSKEPIFSDNEEEAARRDPDDGVAYRYADTVAVAANVAIGSAPDDARAMALHGEDASHSAAAPAARIAAAAPAVVYGNEDSDDCSGRYETVIGGDPAPEGEVFAESSHVLTSAAGKKLAFMTPDGKIIMAHDRQIIRSDGSNFIIVQPSGFDNHD